MHSYDRRSTRHRCSALGIAALSSMGLVGACGFKPTNGPVTDGPVDTHDALDATIPTRFLVTSAEWTQTVGSTKFVVYPFDGNQLGGACITQPAADDVHALVGHPTRPYVYAVESGVQGASVDCSLVSVSNVGVVCFVCVVFLFVFFVVVFVGFLSF